MTDPIVSATIYQDNWLDRWFIRLFSNRIAKVVGQQTDRQGYDGFVDLSKSIMKGRTAQEQQRVVAEVLQSLIPSPILAGIRRWFTPTQWVCEWNAWFASVLFEWLVGPCELKTVEVMDPQAQSRCQKSGVHIKKCRYLEQAGCVGMCINMCKLPTQTFFTEGFGIPLTLIPNFEDFSCEMIFGQAPSPETDAEIARQPCLKLHCEMASAVATVCPKIQI